MKTLNEYLEMSAEDDSAEVTAVLLEYKRENYSDEEIEKYENDKTPENKTVEKSSNEHNNNCRTTNYDAHRM